MVWEYSAGVVFNLKLVTDRGKIMSENRLNE